MGWQDRPYNDGYGDRGSGMPPWLARVLYWLNYAFPIGRYVGINVRVHIMFIALFIAFWLRTGDFFWTLRIEALFFFAVLLHEFGHALACRRVGGMANEILMWPLGGLAFCAPPRRPWPEFVTVACGPLVNLLLAILTFATVGLWMGWAAAPSWNPLYLMTNWSANYISGVPGLLVDAFYINYLLLLFNLALVFFPFDGGRLIQIALWTRVGYARSLMIATTLGMIGAVGVGFYGIVVRQMMLIFIAIFGFYTCYRQRQMLQHEGAAADPYTMGSGDAGFFPDPVDDDEPREGRLGRWQRERREKKEERQRQAQQRQDEEVDRILKKVHEEGLAALTEKEKQTLKQATESKRGA